MEENNNTQTTTIGDDIKAFNDGIDSMVERLHDWKLQMTNLQDDFVQKLATKTAGLKIK